MEHRGRAGAHTNTRFPPPSVHNPSSLTHLRLTPKTTTTTTPKNQDSLVCEKLTEGNASTLQDLLVALYLLLAVVLVTARAAARRLYPWMAARGCWAVAPRIVAREDAAASDVVFSRGVFSPPTGALLLFGARDAGRGTAAVFSVKGGCE